MSDRLWAQVQPPAAVGNPFLYINNITGAAIAEAHTDGTQKTLVATGSSTQPFYICSDGTFLYFTEVGFGTVRKVKLDGTGQTTLLSGLGTSVCGIATDGTHLFYGVSATIRRCNLDGTGDALFISSAGNQGVAIDSTTIWSANTAGGNSTLRSGPIGGGGNMTLAGTLNTTSFGGIRSLGGKVYIADNFHSQVFTFSGGSFTLLIPVVASAWDIHPSADSKTLFISGANNFFSANIDGTNLQTLGSVGGSGRGLCGTY